MSEFASTIREQLVSTCITPDLRENPVYPNLKGKHARFRRDLAEVATGALTSAGPAWRSMVTLDLFDNARESLDWRKKYDTLVETARGGAADPEEDADELVWETFRRVTVTAQAGFGSWKEFRNHKKTLGKMEQQIVPQFRVYGVPSSQDSSDTIIRGKLLIAS